MYTHMHAYIHVCMHTHKLAHLVSLFDSSHSQNDYNNYFIRRGSGPLCLSILKVITRCLYCPSGTASCSPFGCAILWCNLVHHEFQTHIHTWRNMCVYVCAQRCECDDRHNQTLLWLHFSRVCMRTSNTRMCIVYTDASAYMRTRDTRHAYKDDYLLSVCT